MADATLLMGGTLIMYLIIRVVLWAVGKTKLGPKLNLLQSIVLAALVALGIGTLIGGYGMADGRDPVFRKAFLAYFVPVSVAMLIELIRRKIKVKT